MQVSGKRLKVADPEQALASAEHVRRIFCLLTPVSFLLQCENEGASGDMYENKG
jgi:hypothetical protein